MFGIRQREPAAKNFVPTKAQRNWWRVWGHKLEKTDAFALLKQIESAQEIVAAETGPEPNLHWLLHFRGKLRRLCMIDPRCNEGEIDVVRYYLAECPRAMIPVCVCLIGRMADRFHLYELKAFRDDPSPQVRKHVAKALRRLEAWSLLDEMARAYPEDAKIRWFATAPTTHRPFAERLKNLAEHVDHSHAAEAAGPSRMPYWSRNDPWEGRPPKGAWYIRWILWRIRRWVRGA